MTTTAEFEKHVLEKWNHKLSFQESLTNCILGIVGEFFEILELENEFYTARDEAEQLEFVTKVLSELSDIKFYIVRWNLLTSSDTLTDECKSWNYSDTFVPTSKLLGEIKKYNFHGKSLDYTNFNKHIKTLNMIVNDVARTFGFDNERIMEYNIVKLNKRHGESFKTFQEQNN